MSMLQSGTPTANPKRILLLADDVKVGGAITERLTQAGYDIRWALNTVEAQFLWSMKSYAAVFIAARKYPDKFGTFVQSIKSTDPEQTVLLLN
jgi:DNA-binding response OmpR family regulator